MELMKSTYVAVFGGRETSSVGSFETCRRFGFFIFLFLFLFFSSKVERKKINLSYGKNFASV